MSEAKDDTLWEEWPNDILMDEKKQFIGPKGFEETVERTVYKYRDKDGFESMFDYIDYSKLPQQFRAVSEDKTYLGKKYPESHVRTNFNYLDTDSGNIEIVTKEDIIKDACAFRGNIKHLSSHIEYLGLPDNPRTHVKIKHIANLIGENGIFKPLNYEVEDFQHNEPHVHIKASEHEESLKRKRTIENIKHHIKPEKECNKRNLSGYDTIKNKKTYETTESRALKDMIDEAIQKPETIRGNTVTKEVFDKIMKEENYDCKNPVLFKNLVDTGSLDIGYPAKAAEALGKCLQGLMKLNKEDKLSEQTLTNAIDAIMSFDHVNNNALHFCRKNTLKILAATWEKGEQVFNILGGDKEIYQTFCRNMNKNYVKNVFKTPQKTIDI